MLINSLATSAHILCLLIPFQIPPLLVYNYFEYFYNEKNIILALNDFIMEYNRNEKTITYE